MCAFRTMPIEIIHSASLNTLLTLVITLRLKHELGHIVSQLSKKNSHKSTISTTHYSLHLIPAYAVKFLCIYLQY